MTKQLDKNIRERLGIKALTPMQTAMAALSMPASAILLSPTGSGKTLAFAIPFIKSLGHDHDNNNVKGLVITPTRELALQVFETVRVLAAPTFKTTALYGGHSFDTERKSLEGKPDIIVATPGRLLDHLGRSDLRLDRVETLVLDEFDKSLDLGFLPDTERIYQSLKSLKSIILTSATALPELPEFLSGYDFATFDYAHATEVQPTIEFKRVESPAADKLDTLISLLRDLSGEKVMVFVNHRDAAERVYKALSDNGFSAGLYHGGLEQDLRHRALALFANGTDNILVSTDLAARGLDIDGVGAIIHYHLPVDAEAMTHRNGRTARMGASGRAFAIVSDHDKVPDYFPTLEQYWPDGTAEISKSKWETLYFNIGKKEKISRGDIVGFLIHKGGLKADEIGRIELADHCAYVAVPVSVSRRTEISLQGQKIKNKRVRVSRLK
ncbi:MAG: DEAD/DEAH box helicase [Muribaculaceae bacterium]|nr:DEAD/DEAH box helicase [Muribaculaceae bacterium]